ncbi:MAG: DEAD/DEAH box helicase [Bacteriovoracaceae bacterium]|nr:DEAD/DEAH box helicase [Bacteriovoracaceae bacterium]
MTFQELQLSQPLNQALLSMGFSEPTSIQKQAIPMLLESKGDFVGQAQTGTGKTAAFLLPLLEGFNYESDFVESLILTPTRELAVQVHQELEKLAKFTTLRSTTVYGGSSYEKQIKALRKDKAQVVVGTPGRVLDLIRRGNLKLNNCSKFIIDEADEMLNMGFLEDVETIMSELPQKKNIWMFSATMPAPIKKLVEKNFSSPQFIKTADKTLTNTDIKQYYCLLDKRDFVKGLRRIMAANSQANAIVFCETRMECKNISEKLIDLGVQALPLHGDLSQSQREYAMGRFKAGKVQLLICTDIAARGIDVNDLNFVFNMGFPRQDEAYVHRIGRTGRAGVQGTAVTFCEPKEKYRLKFIERKTGQALESYDLPNLNELKQAKVLNEIEKMSGLKTAVVDLGEEFTVDETYEMFRQDLLDLSKDQILKLFYSLKFNKEFRMLEEALVVNKPKPARDGKLRVQKRRGRTAPGAGRENGPSTQSRTRRVRKKR